MKNAGYLLFPKAKVSSSRRRKQCMRPANEIGFPVTIKATAGGGGRGIRLDEPGEFVKLLQVLPDKYGNVAHVGCSIQLIVWAPTREKAIERMKRAMDDTIITGIPTTIDYHKLIFNIQDFKNGIVDTAFTPKHEDELQAPSAMVPVKETVNSAA